MTRERPSAAELFEAAASPQGADRLDKLGLELIARPGTKVPAYAPPGLCAIRRAFGEGRLAVVIFVERLAPDRGVLEADGIRCEGHGPGVFIDADTGHGRRGLQIAGPDGVVRHDFVLFRDRSPARVRTERPAVDDAVEDADTALLATLIAAVYALRRRRSRTVPEDYLRSQLEPPSGRAPLGGDLDRSVAELRQRPAAVDDLAGVLLLAAERAFILDTDRSALELLAAADRDRYLNFAWHPDDFPGGPKGPNEDRADQMFAALTRLRPERRANVGDAAVVRREEFDLDMQRRLEDALVAVPGEHGQRLHRDASAAYVEMRAAAAGDGVMLAIGNSYRRAARAQANAARAGNAAAVASFSSHTLGLAIDLRMSQGRLRVTETTTAPFQNVVDMYRSPVHKWMFLRADVHGWYPYRREPWHWEYNPPGFRERIRQSPQSRADGPEAADTAENITDPIRPPRAPLPLSGTVGRGGRNHPADVRAVQDRLIELRAADAAAIAPERPSGTSTVADESLAQTIDAIESFERQMALPIDGIVRLDGATRAELDRVIPVPTREELAAVGAARQTIMQTVNRGLTIGGPVGATRTGNAVADVRAVQQRLVEIGRLSGSHGEGPAAGTTGVVPEARLPSTIRALRNFEHDVRFFLARGSISGTVTSGVVQPGDATAALLDRIAVYQMAAGPTRVSFHDHVASTVMRSETGIDYSGIAQPSSLPLDAYTSVGLSRGEAAALQKVSESEGKFDGINTYDRATVSVGFIQFAGGRGLPPYIARVKARQPAKFRELFQRFGIDVEFSVSRGAIAGARLVVLDPAGGRVLRGADAEAAIRDDKRLTTALILSGRDRDIQAVQIEAAVVGYVRPALNAVVTPSTRGGRVRLGDVLRSQKGMAALFDRTIQEGLGAARRRFERVIQRMVRASEPRPLPTPAPPPTAAQLQSREGDIRSEIERDLQAATDVHVNLTRARTSLASVSHAASATGATVAGVLARPELAAARQALTAARAGIPDVVNISTGGNVDERLASIAAALAAEEARLAFTPTPASVTDMAATLTASRRTLDSVAGPFSTAPMFLRRIQSIQRSALDARLTEAA